MQMQQSMQTLQQSGLIPPVPGVPPIGGLGFGAGAPSFGAPQGTAGAAGAPAGQPSTIGGLDFSALLGGVGARPAGATAPPAAPTARFAEQLRQLNSMGFTDEAANIRALTSSNGNVNAAVERLLGGV